jgi:hypothetical protein
MAEQIDATYLIKYSLLFCRGTMDEKAVDLFQDYRWNPVKYSHPYRNNNFNLPEQEFTDIFGGTRGER